MAYTTQALVLEELNLASSTISASSVPSSSTIASWISDAADEIDKRTGRIWDARVVTSSAYEYADYDGSGRIRTSLKPIIGVTELSFEENGVGQAQSWVTATEGRAGTGDFIVYKDTGVIKYHGALLQKTPKVALQGVRLAYTAGCSTTPGSIQRLATLLVARRYVSSIVSKSATTEGGSISVGTISVTDPNNFSINRLDSLTREIEDLYRKVVGEFKAYMLDTQVYD